MPYNEFKLTRTTPSQLKGIQESYYYESDSETLDEILAVGYFDGFPCSDDCETVVTVNASDGWANIHPDGEGGSSESVNVLIGDKTAQEVSDGVTFSIDNSLSQSLKSNGTKYPSLSIVTPITAGSFSSISGGEFISNSDDRLTALGGNGIYTNEDYDNLSSASSLTYADGSKFSIAPKISFLLDSDEFEVFTKNETQALRLFVNGKLASNNNIFPGDGSDHYIRFDVSSEQGEKEILLEWHSGAWFGGLVIPDGSTIKSIPSKQSIVFMGDSFTEGTGKDPQSMFASWAGYTARKLGFVNYALSGFGGTGYLKGFEEGGGRIRPSLMNRLSTDSIGYDVIIIAMGFNDDDADITENLKSIYGSLRQLNPRSQVVIVGAWGDGFGAAVKPLIENSIIAAVASQSSFTYIQAYDIEFSKSDAVHPDNEGHLALGREITGRINAALVKSLLSPSHDRLAYNTNGTSFLIMNDSILIPSSTDFALKADLLPESVGFMWNHSLSTSRVYFTVDELVIMGSGGETRYPAKLVLNAKNTLLVSRSSGIMTAQLNGETLTASSGSTNNTALTFDQFGKVWGNPTSVIAYNGYFRDLKIWNGSSYYSGSPQIDLPCNDNSSSLTDLKGGSGATLESYNLESWQSVEV